MAKSKINSPHDKFVKEMFADKQMALAFLQEKLPKALGKLLDFESITYENTSFLNKNLVLCLDNKLNYNGSYFFKDRGKN